MILQDYPEALNYVNAKLHPLAPKCGSFLDAFLHACQAADWIYFPYLYPALLLAMEKSPADPVRLWMEYHDSGMEPPFPMPEDL